MSSALLDRRLELLQESGATDIDLLLRVGRRTPLFQGLRLLFRLVFLIQLIDQRCFALLTPEIDAECHPVEIQLYTWAGPEFDSGECWYQGHRYVHGSTWGRLETSGSPSCLCEHGKVRIFYSQQVSRPSADALTLLRPTDGVLATSKDLLKWPIASSSPLRQRMVLCSRRRLGIRIRSRDGCLRCKCSIHGHWLCRKKDEHVK